MYSQTGANALSSMTIAVSSANCAVTLAGSRERRAEISSSEKSVYL